MRIDLHPIPPASAETGSVKSRAVDAVQPVSLRQGARFEALLGQREKLSRRSLRGDVEQSSASGGLTPDLFGTTRSLEILEYVLHDVLDQLDADPETKAFAHQLIEEEIDMRRSLEQQRAEVQA
jgi:hypothetical protein